VPESLPLFTRTVTTAVTEVPQQQAVQSSNATTLVGSLLGAAVGAAAGAALTYSVMRNDRDRVPVPEYAAPQQYDQRTLVPQDPTYQTGVMTHKPRRYVEVERTVEKVRYPEAYAPLLLANGSASSVASRSPPQYLAKYSQASSNSRRSREADDAYDMRSRHSARQPSHAPSRARTRSEAATTRNPFLLTDYQHQSPPGSSHAPPSQHSRSRQQQHPSSDYHRHSPPGGTQVSSSTQRSRSHHTGGDYERAMSAAAPSYASSSRSQRTESTIRQHPPTVTRSTATSRGPVTAPPLSRGQSHVSARNVALPPSRVDGGASTVYSARDYDWAPQPSTVVRAARPSRPPVTGVPQPSRTASYASARDVRLPLSRAGSRYTARDDDDDGDSIAPSDSISCVASRRSAKSYYG
jgi:hypothetical protein